MTEHDIQNEIRIRLSQLGFCVFRINAGKVKLHDGRWFDTGVPKGFSDLLAVKDGRAYFIEVKSENGKASPEQKHRVTHPIQTWFRQLTLQRLQKKQQIMPPMQQK